MKISVILPVLNEQELLPQTLQAIQNHGDENVEIIVSDGGSTDKTLEIARNYTDKVISAQRGRGNQMNRGASLAKGDVLFFLHGDSRIGLGGMEAIRNAFQDKHVVGGAFSLVIDSSHVGLKLISGMANFRTWMTHIPYGDQGIFVKRAVFDRLGGFGDLPLMEDLDFCRRLKREGRMMILNDKMMTSPRRWEKEGILKVTIRNQFFLLLYYMGLSPANFIRWYPGIR